MQKAGKTKFAGNWERNVAMRTFDLTIKMVTLRIFVVWIKGLPQTLKP